MIVTYQDQVYALVTRLLYRHQHQVDDVSQDVFLKVIRAIGQFDRAGPARLSTWILTIATRTCFDVLSKHQRHQQLDGQWLRPAVPSNLEVEVAHNQLAGQVSRAVDELPEDHRTVLVLRAFHELDYDEIAKILKVEPGTVKSRLNRARERLRALFPGASHG